MVSIIEPPLTDRFFGGTYVGSNGDPRQVDIHDEEYPLSATSAEDIARYFTGTGIGGFAHYVLDSDSLRHGTPESWLAWHAPPNTGSIGIERDGYASWSAAQWAAPAARRTTANQAALTASILLRRHGRLRYLDVATLTREGPAADGWTEHRNKSAAFGQSTHTDLGPYFSVDDFQNLLDHAASIFTSDSLVAQVQENAHLTVDRVVGPLTILATGAVIAGAAPAPAPPPVPRPPLFPLPAGNYFGLPSSDPACHSGYYWPTDRPGIIAIQGRLGLTRDGRYGPVTFGRVQAFQRSVGIAADGLTGAVTWGHLFS